MTSLARHLRQSNSIALVALGNLLSRWPRALVALIAIALGVALVTAVTSGYASARQTILDWNYSWVGRAQIHVQPIPSDIWADPRLPPALAERIAALPDVARIVTRQKEYLLALTPGQREGEIVYGYGIEEPAGGGGGEREVRSAGISLESGRLLRASGEVLIEKHLAESLKLAVGDRFELAWLSWEMRVVVPARLRPFLLKDKRQSFTVVGIISRPRFSMVSSANVFQLRDLVMIRQGDMNRLFWGQAPPAATAPASGPARPPPAPVAAERDVGGQVRAGEAREGLGLESLDVMMAEAEPKASAIHTLAERIRGIVADYNREHPGQAPIIEVETAADKIAQLDRNMAMFRLVSQTVSVIALLTAGYLIFATLGMGMMQRQAELGMLRCVGAGRSQVALATLAEAVPIAVVGIVLGLGLGLAAAKGVILYYHMFFTRMVVSGSGLLLAGFGGLAAVLLAVALPAWLASRVSPLAASRPQTRHWSVKLDVLLGLAGLGLIGLSLLTQAPLLPGQTAYGRATTYLAVGAPLLFLGYFLAAPLVVSTLGRLLKYVAALVLWVRPRLLDDQMQTARWRTAATFCALMVGISLLVNLRVRSESVKAGWQLPTGMPPGFLFFFEPLSRENLQRVLAEPEIRQPIPLMAPWVRYQSGSATDSDSVQLQFIAGPVRQLGELVQLKFVEIEGQHAPFSDDAARWALDQVEAGRAVIATREFATRYNVKVGQQARFWRHDRGLARTYTVVGVVESPTMDMAVDFLNVRDRFQNLASGAVIGSVAEANRLLSTEFPAATRPGEGVAGELPLQARLLMFDFASLPSADRRRELTRQAEALEQDKAQAVAASQPERVELLDARLAGLHRQLASNQQEQLDGLGQDLRSLGLQFYAGSLNELRKLIIGEFDALVSILAKIALWAMGIASLGVGFSMAANVHSRRRQLAVLRAVGATQFQLSRLVLAEAVTIALLGSFLGIVHGLHLAVNGMWLDRTVFGLQPRLTLHPTVLAVAIGFAVGCCLVASLLPALRTGRTNILAAMRQL